jgi:probable phosphoglycerate mutase
VIIVIEIDLVRHGRTVFNEERRVQGMADSELTANGRQQALALGHGLQLAGKTYGQIYASDLQRAHDTAQLITQGMVSNLDVRTDTGLREEDYDHYEGWPVDDFARTVLGVPSYKNAIATGRYTLETIADKTRWVSAQHNAATTAESTAMVVARVDAALRRIAARAQHTASMRTLVVSHGTALLMWLASAGKGVPGLESLQNCSVTTVYFDEGVFSIKTVNELIYLEQGTMALRKTGKSSQ